MKKRNLAAVFGLSLITLGFYDLYWLIKVKKELNAKTKVHTPSIWILFLPVILFVIAFIVVIVSTAHSSGTTTITSTSYQSSTQAATTPAGPSIIGLLVTVVAFIIVLPVTFFWLFRFSKAVNEYTNGKMNTGVTFLLLWIIHFIGVLLIQDAFNDMIDGGIVPGEGALAPVPAPVTPGQSTPAAFAPPQVAVNSPYVGQVTQQPTHPSPVQPQPQPTQTFSDVVSPSPLPQPGLPPAPSGPATVIQPTNPDNNHRPLIQ